MDLAPYHSGQEIRSYMRKMQLPIIYTGAYSYDASPIESLFSLLKLGNLNPDKKSTGKKYVFLCHLLIL